MSGRSTQFKRMVLKLPQGAGDYAAVHTAADLAELLGLRLSATFIEDIGLLQLGGLPCVREFRSLGDGWRPIDDAEIGRDIERAAVTARQMFAAIASARRVEANFVVARGSAHEVIAGMAQSDDIVVVIEPRNPAEQVTQQLRSLIDAAFRSAAGVMFIPSRPVNRDGPVVAVVRSRDDPSIAAAMRIAMAAGAPITIIFVAGDPLPSSDLASMMKSSGLTIKQTAVCAAPLDPAMLVSTLTSLKESVMVMTRGTLDVVVPRTIASLKGIPVLVIEPEQSPS
jgi:hypothetical protein